MFPSWLASRRRLSPLFDEGAQILVFPAPISCLGIRRLAARLSTKAMPRHKGRCVGARSMANIPLVIQRRPGTASRRWPVVFFKLSRLLNQEDALSAPYLYER